MNRLITWIKNIDKKKLIIAGIAAAIVIIAVIVAVVLACTGKSKEASAVNSDASEALASSENTTLDEPLAMESTAGEDTEANTDEEVSDADDDTTEGNTTKAAEIEIIDTDDDYDVRENQADASLGSGAAVDISQTSSGEAYFNEACSIGIDVAKYQGTIDWEQVAADGIDFVMIRVGYRSIVSGEINEDPYAEYNIVNALKNDIQVGIYFFSSAISEEEAIEEAQWVMDFIKNYNITYPVAYNCEGFSESDSRQYDLTKSQRTEIAVKFLEAISEGGYTPMFYASKYEMENSNMWDMSLIENNFKVWVAWYPEEPYPETESPSYTGEYHMWQYTNNGTVSGISGAVDINVSYMDIEAGESKTSESEASEEITVSPEADMTFEEVNETVTAKIEVNLRDKPSQDSDSTVLYTLKNGETALRTGVSDSGWSRLEYNGNVCYAVSSYLTTDLSQEESTTEAEQETETTLKNQFTENNDIVTAKEEVNLRTLPSTTDSEVVYTLKNGENVQRTGVSDLGWSRVIYNGQTLYCITSYLEVVE